MEDRELLELAARAAGYDVIYLRDGSIGVRTPEGSDYWNSLEDDGDALRLAVTLGILLRTDFIKLLARLLGEGIEKEAATRRAITIIAADIGRLKALAQAGG